MVRDLLLEEARDMSDEAIREVIDFMQFLKKKRVDSVQQESAILTERIIRKPGIYQGKIWIADDFDAPLDDFKEYM